MRCKYLIAVPMLLAALAPMAAHADKLDDARRDIAALRYDRAEQTLVDLVRSVEGSDRQAALFMLAGLKRSAAEAEIIYQEVVSIDSSNDWADRAQLELAKIQYALGNYNKSFAILEGSSACRTLDEACYFHGISAVMLERFIEAEALLTRVNRSSLAPWATLSLAEIEMKKNDLDQACRQYESIAEDAQSPPAMYRYAECLEQQGRARDANVMFSRLLNDYANTPEGILAGEKLAGLRQREQQRDAGAAVVDTPDESASAEFTLQFGAFNERTNAIKLAADIKRKIPGVRIDSDVVQNKEIHRVRYGYYRTREEAQKGADEISARIDEAVSIMTFP